MSHETYADYVYEGALLRAKKAGLNDAEARRYAQEEVRRFWMGDDDDGQAA